MAERRARTRLAVATLERLAGMEHFDERHMLRELETGRLTLRELRLDDAPALQRWPKSPPQWQHQAMEPEEFADTAARVGRYLQHRGEGAERRLFVYVAIEKASGVLMASAGLSRSGRSAASLGLAIAASHAGQGFATEIAAQLLAYGFEDLALHRICAGVALENAACLRVMEKIGMVREGVARDCIWAQGRWWTEAQYAMLRSDYVRAGARSEAVAVT
jgi:RimJ/RimL family protein N-acetyltransferase